MALTIPELTLSSLLRIERYCENLSLGEGLTKSKIYLQLEEGTTELSKVLEMARKEIDERFPGQDKERICERRR